MKLGALETNQTSNPMRNILTVCEDGNHSCSDTGDDELPLHSMDPTPVQLLQLLSTRVTQRVDEELIEFAVWTSSAGLASLPCPSRRRRTGIAA